MSFKSIMLQACNALLASIGKRFLVTGWLVDCFEG